MHKTYNLRVFPLFLYAGVLIQSKVCLLMSLISLVSIIVFDQLEDELVNGRQVQWFHVHLTYIKN